jgi:hypothetical protein
MPVPQGESKMPEPKEHKARYFEGKLPEETRMHFQTAREEFQKSMEGILPPGFVEHHRKARKEMLLAWRSIIDASLERMNEPGKKS